MVAIIDDTDTIESKTPKKPEYKNKNVNIHTHARMASNPNKNKIEIHKHLANFRYILATSTINITGKTGDEKSERIANGKNCTPYALIFKRRVKENQHVLNKETISKYITIFTQIYRQ